MIEVNLWSLGAFTLVLFVVNGADFFMEIKEDTTPRWKWIVHKVLWVMLGVLVASLPPMFS